MKIITSVKLISFSLVLSMVAGCAAHSRGQMQNSGSDRLIYAASVSHLPHKKIQVSRDSLKQSIAKGPGAMRIRLVELFSGASSTPRYRVLGFDKGGPYQYLDIQHGDVILAANNFVIRQSSMFPDYVRLLAETNVGSIHILRGGQEIILAYSIS